jgi:hypothetical protein
VPAVPVTAALVLAPTVVFVAAPSPAVVMNNNAGVPGIFIALVRVPTDVADTGNSC